MPRNQEREDEALERRDGDVIVPLVTGVDSPDGWKTSGPAAWLVDWIGKKLWTR